MKKRRGGDRIALGKALEALQRGASMEPTGRRSACSAKRDWAALSALAATTLRQAIEKLPADRITFLHLADAAERAGHPAEARTALLDYHSLSAETDRRLPDVAKRIADLSVRLDDLSAAKTWYATAARLSSSSPDLLEIARAQLRLRDEAGAGVTLERVLEKDPGNDQARALRASTR